MAAIAIVGGQGVRVSLMPLRLRFGRFLQFITDRNKSEKDGFQVPIDRNAHGNRRFFDLLRAAIIQENTGLKPNGRRIGRIAQICPRGIISENLDFSAAVARQPAPLLVFAEDVNAINICRAAWVASVTRSLGKGRDRMAALGVFAAWR